jgi:hypothetical protein
MVERAIPTSRVRKNKVTAQVVIEESFVAECSSIAFQFTGQLFCTGSFCTIPSRVGDLRGDLSVCQRHHPLREEEIVDERCLRGSRRFVN